MGASYRDCSWENKADVVDDSEDGALDAKAKVKKKGVPYVLHAKAKGVCEERCCWGLSRAMV